MPSRGTRRIVFRPLAAYTTAYLSRTYNTPYHNGMVLNIRATALAATPGVTMSIEGWDTDGSGTWVSLLADAAVTTAAPTHSELKLYPGAITAANVALDRPLPARWRVRVAVADADSLTYELFADIFAA